MSDASPAPPDERIVASTIEIIEADGYEAVVLQKVARRARVSLSTIYKLFPTGGQSLSTREELIVRAVERWMLSAYPPAKPPLSSEHLYDRLMSMVRYIVGPWERSPRMLVALDRARGGPAEDRLTPKIAEAVEPMRQGAYVDCDPRFAADVDLILTLLLDALIRQFADGQIHISDVESILERAVFRLCSAPAPSGGHEATTGRRPRKARSAKASSNRSARSR